MINHQNDFDYSLLNFITRDRLKRLLQNILGAILLILIAMITLGLKSQETNVITNEHHSTLKNKVGVANPISDEINISVGEFWLGKVVEVNVLDLEDNLVLSHKRIIDEYEFSIIDKQITTLKTGTYVIQLKSKTLLSSQKLIKL